MKKIYSLPTSLNSKLNLFCICLISIFCSFGCASNYRHVEPHSMRYMAEPDILHDCNVEITYRYNILENAKNKKYVRMEQRSGISLLAVRIANNGNDTLFIPEDLEIATKKYNVFPLDMDEAIGVFIQDNPLLDEMSGAANIQINTGWGWVVPLAVSIPSLINNSIEEKANDRFVKEMLDYYLVSSNVPPGETVSGLLALPVKSNTPLRFKKRKNF